MKHKLEKGNKGAFWSTRMSSELSLVRKSDRNIVLLTVISLIPCIIAYYFLSETGKYGTYDLIPILTMPLFFAGVLVYVGQKRWKQFLVILVITAVLAVLWYLEYVDISVTVLFFVMFILIGATGVVFLAEAIQRAIFYRVVHSIEYMNVKKKLSLWDKSVAFLFNVPDDLDTRNITMNYNLQRTSIPWKEMMQTIMTALMLGMFIWIYVSMNPSFMQTKIIDSIPVFMFSLILIIPLLVLPLTIFKSLDVRVETNYRAFRIHNGAMETLKRMALPIMAALFFVLLAINKSDPLRVLTFIGISALAIIFVVGYTCIFFYTTNEREIVSDIVAKWKIFRPVPIFAGLEEERGKQAPAMDGLPGTPVRDRTDFGELILPPLR
ncbi:MAG: hypothetical protein ACOX8L_00565 [Candidatus Methanomethylophilaceae archaeon]|jgi:hypothetical protein